MSVWFFVWSGGGKQIFGWTVTQIYKVNKEISSTICWPHMDLIYLEKLFIACFFENGNAKGKTCTFLLTCTLLTNQYHSINNWYCLSTRQSILVPPEFPLFWSFKWGRYRRSYAPFGPCFSMIFLHQILFWVLKYHPNFKIPLIKSPPNFITFITPLFFYIKCANKVC